MSYLHPAINDAFEFLRARNVSVNDPEAVHHVSVNVFYYVPRKGERRTPTRDELEKSIESRIHSTIIKPGEYIHHGYQINEFLWGLVWDVPSMGYPIVKNFIRWWDMHIDGKIHDVIMRDHQSLTDYIQTDRSYTHQTASLHM